MSRYDAIGNEVLVIDDELKNLGYESQIYSENIDPYYKNKVKQINDFKNKIKKGDLIIYHHSIGTDIVDLLLLKNIKLIMVYHNVTPPEFFKGFNEELAFLCGRGINQLNELKDKVEFTVTMSEYSKIELEMLGYKKISVIPMLLDKSKYKHQTDTDFISKFKNSTNILYVGRIVNSKQIDQILRIFHYYNSNINPNSNLFLVGSYSGIGENYYEYLQSMINKAKIQNVHFVKNADDAKLVTLYNLANIFITMSKHEGFCVPLIESMMFKVPIIANNSSAIPHTLSGAGILIGNERYEEVGELIDMILTDEKIKQQIIEKQSKRLAQIYSKTNETMVEEIIQLVK